MPDTYTNLKYHFVFSTKSRMPWLDAELRPALFDFMSSLLLRRRCMPLAFGGVEDHVHLLVGLRPSFSVSEILRLVKANSSKWINELPARQGVFAWQTGYAAFSVSESQVPVVKRYVLNQEEHHRQFSFDDEIRRLVAGNQLDWQGPLSE